MPPLKTILRATGPLGLALLLAALLPAAALATTARASAGAARLRIVDLGTLGGCCSFAEGINDHGEVVGSSDVGESISHAFLWRRGHMSDLGTLGELGSVATDINNRRQVVGYSNTTA